MIAVVLQGRLDSKRLPGKSLLPLGKKPLIFRVMEALKNVPADLYVLACPEDCAESFGPAADQAGFVLSTGPKEDVLERYCIAVRRFGIQRLIRATADNPFVFADAAREINAEALSLGAAYAGYSGIPYGAGVESVDADALLRAGREASQPDEREHVCPYLYRHGDVFPLHRPLAPQRWQGALRLTVDTREDYERALLLYDALPSTPERYMGSTIIATATTIAKATNNARAGSM
jgi:spore coat polysaccharide biosynthesis protein SpsF